MRQWKARFAALENGLKVVAVEAPHLATAFAALLVGVGSRHETEADNGLTHFLEHMVFRGTASYPHARDLNAAAEAIGGNLDGATYRDHAVFSTTFHPSELATALELLGEIVTSPRFGQLEIERGIIQEELRESLGAEGQMAELDTIAHALIYGTHPLGQAIEGPLANVSRFGRRDLTRHLRRHFTAANSVVVLSGPLTLAAAMPHVRRCFGQLACGSRRFPQPPPPWAPSGRSGNSVPTDSAKHSAPSAQPAMRWVRDPGAQVDLRVSFRALSAVDPDYDALAVLSRVLGEGLSSRLHSELIDEQGLAYSLSAGPEIFSDCGTFDFDITVAPDKAVKATHELLRFARETQRLAPSKRELEQVRQRHLYALDFMSDAPADLGMWFGRGMLFELDHDFDAARRRFVAVKANDCLRVARRVFGSASVGLSGVGDLGRRDQAHLRQALARYAAASR